MILERVFHPVGQGAFFSEIFRGDGDSQPCFRVVYDCGTSDGKKFVNNAIGRYCWLYGNNHIDLLCLSHLDSDHVNGVELLVSRGLLNSDTVVLIPFVFDLQVLIAFNPAVARLFGLLDGSGVRIVRISPDEEESRPNEEVRSVESLNNGDIIPSGTRIVPPCAGGLWQYVPLMHEDEYQNARKMFLNKLKKLKQIDITRLYDPIYVQQNISKLRDIYSKIPGVAIQGKRRTTNINMNSLMLLSCPYEGVQVQVEENWVGDHSYNHDFYYYYIHNNDYYYNNVLDGQLKVDSPSCLYTGDTNLSDYRIFDRLLNRVKGYYPFPLGLLQIPHHGSAHNYGAHIAADNRYQMTFINFNSYKKVFYGVIPIDMMFFGKTWIPVTERIGFKQRINF